jgi:hypothetical protein
MPRHPRKLLYGQRITHIIVHVMEIHNASIVIILPGKEGAVEFRWMHVGKGVAVRVPATEAEVEPADGGIVVVYDDDLGVGLRDGV